MKIFQPIITGSLKVSGSVTAIDFTGSLYGTSSYAITASYALKAESGGFPYTGSAIITGSLIVTGSTTSTQGFTGSLFGTASWAGNSISSSYALSSSYATTSSYALVAETLLGGVTSASYAATSSYSNIFTVNSQLIIDSTLIDYASVNSTIVGSNNLFNQATGSYRAAFGKYTIYKGTSARAGEFMTVWNSTLPTVYSDTSTIDIGNTTDITFSSVLVGGSVQINAVAASSGWTIKMLTTFI